MSPEELNQVALAFTVKTSEATQPEQFLADYEKNKSAFKNVGSDKSKSKFKIMNKSDFGL
ncbi:MAG: hypothetical protein HFI15_03385 [Lachnospiraceae bacterium]|nr:hypothetical protein [Lachnospiraceae bacterium]